MRECEPPSGTSGQVDVRIAPYQEPMPEIVVPDSHEASPFTQYVIKVQSRCNLGCDDCFMYQGANAKDRRAVGCSREETTMSDATTYQCVDAINEHIETHDLPSTHIVLHGGEPLLDPQRTLRIVDILHNEIRAQDLGIRIQTNGTTITRGLLEQLRGKAEIGLSHDGLQADHDVSRPFISGRGSYAVVNQNAELLKEYPDVFRELLCVVRNFEGDAEATYTALRQLIPETLPDGASDFKMHFIFPHASWDQLPQQPGEDGIPPVAKWVFGHDGKRGLLRTWLKDDGYPRVRIPFLRNIMEDLDQLNNPDVQVGGQNGGGFTGSRPVRFATIDLDGSIGEVDTMRMMRSGYHGEAVGLNVHDEGFTFDKVLALPQFAIRQAGINGMPQMCRERCPLGPKLMSVCGGGMYEHRMRRTLEAPSFVPNSKEDLRLQYGTDNPTPYCETNQWLIHGIAAVRASLAGYEE
jgi:uncharacterized protein